LADNFEQLLDGYFALASADRDRFFRACYWYRHALRAAGFSRSAAYNALVSAVEALMPNVSPEAHCPECKRPLGVGPTKRFIDFVEKQATGGGTSKPRRQLYYLRSALSHGGKLLHTDRFSWTSMTSDYIADQYSQRELWQLVRYVLMSWLFNPHHAPKVRS
jgi:hypothetical protein